MNDLKDVFEVRRRNLQRLVTQHGGISTLAKLMGYTGPSYISQMMRGHRSMTERAASMLETKLGLPSGWMEREHSASERVAPEALGDAGLAAIALYGAMEDTGYHLSSEKFAEVLGLVQRDLKSHGYVDSEHITVLLKLVSQ